MEATPRILELMPQNHGQILMMRDVTWLGKLSFFIWVFHSEPGRTSIRKDSNSPGYWILLCLCLILVLFSSWCIWQIEHQGISIPMYSMWPKILTRVKKIPIYNR
jgi:peptidoglycan/LPS O-acetylase OafA/YrhL